MDLKVQAFYEYEKFQKSKIGKEYRPMGDADYFAEGFLIGLKADGGYAVLSDVIAEIERESSDVGESYITIEKDRLKNILGNYFA